jgi:GNAT superfamily N-acetyltransferase
VVRHLQHIEVDRDKHNLGIGSLLVRRVYDDTRADGHSVLTSARSVRYVRDLVRVLHPRVDVPAVRDFTAEVRERLPVAAGHAVPR